MPSSALCVKDVKFWDRYQTLLRNCAELSLKSGAKILVCPYSDRLIAR